MLATIPSQLHGGPSQYHSTHDTYDYTEPEAVMEDRLCPGCKKSAVNENGGLVVAFGQSFFHVDCFKCAKCEDQVTADTNLLLLSDGSPICANCSYSCNVCNLPILDEAIMTGDDSYHAHCFKCKVCKTRIDELVFAKTSQGIYCMNCHNDRMAKIRRHAQKKREREKANGSSSKSRDRGAAAGAGAGEFGALSPAVDGAFTSDSPNRSQASVTPTRNRQPAAAQHATERNKVYPPRPSAKSSSIPLVSDAFEPNTKIPAPTAISIIPESPPRSHRPHKSLSVTVAPPNENGDYTLSSSPSPSNTRFQDHPPAFAAPNESATSSSTMLDYLQPSNSNGGSPLQRKKSYDDGTRPLNVLFGRGANAENPHETLSIPGNGSTTPRHDKRHSFQALHEVNTGSSTHAHSPSSPRSASYPQSLSPHDMSDSPSSAPPTRDRFPKRTSSPQPLSPQVNSVRNSASTDFLSASGSPLPPDLHQDLTADESTPRTRPGNSSTYVPEDRQGEHSSPSLKPSVALDHIPSKVESPIVRDQLRLSADVSGVGQERSSPTLGPNEHRLSSNSNSEGRRSASGSRSRPASDLRRADVPHSIESGTDTEGEREESERRSGDTVDHLPPPAPPPQESKDDKPQPKEVESGDDNDSEADLAPDRGKKMQSESAEDLEESEVPVESTSVATFIAPALPPIRFSMTGADFSDMLKNVGGMPSLKALDQLAKLTEEGDNTLSMPSPNTAVPFTPSPVTAQSPPVVRNKSLRKPPPIAGPEGRPNAEESRAPPTSFGQSSSQSKRHFIGDNERSRNQSSGPAHNGWSLTSSASSTPVTVTAPDSSISRPLVPDNSDLVVRRLQEAYADATERGAQQLKLDKGFVEAILTGFDQRHRALEQLSLKYDGMRRTSQQYVDGLTVASTEYDQELKARRDAEAEVTRLRVLLSGQAVRLTTISGEAKKQEMRQQMSQELSGSLDELQHNLSKLKVERDMALAEVEELTASKSSPTYANGEVPTAKLGRSLTMRLDNIKSQYQRELVPLTQQRDALTREIIDLKATRDMFLEETTVLNARNEELAQLSAQYARRMETSHAPDAPPTYRHEVHPPPSLERKSSSFDKSRPQHFGSSPGMQPSFSTSTNSSAALSDESHTSLGKSHKNPPEMTSSLARPGKFKWKGSKTRDPSSVVVADHKAPGRREHMFQQLSVLRFTRCDHCGDKMWGSQLRCSGCNVSVHVRCINHVQVACSHNPPSNREPQGSLIPLPPSMFGRDLAEQIRADARGGERQVPIIVEKCIDAVEALGLDYEGIYRKNGGSGQSKAITQLFERGDYRSFDLRDQDQFNDICSVTSVLKTYLRSLPVPLLTYDLHDEFIMAATIKDPDAKYEALLDTVNKLPNEYYYTLRLLMLHLHNVRQHSEVNLMTSRNLGVVFGPTLMRSPDPGAEFSDMAGKAVSVEWLVDNAPAVFAPPLPSH